MDENVLFISAKESGERIDALLAADIDNLSRSAAQNLIEKGLVSIDYRPVKKNYRCAEGDLIRVVLPHVQEIELVAQNIPLEIAYEDQDLIVINKPRGMVVHPAPGHPNGTMVNALMYHCGDSLSGIGGEKRPGIVHRIDKDTSGLIVAAKNDFAHQGLAAQLADHSMYRIYEAVVRGTMKDDSGTIDRPIGRHPTDRKKMAVTDRNARNAVTHWEVIARYKGYTHIRCRLETGRTHQIRVHMASVGHPLLGDYTYGAPSMEKGLDGQCLHARQLRFIHPGTQKEMLISSELPEYFIQILNKLGGELN